MEFVKWFATLGVGGILAAFMFHFYRKDVKLYTEQWRGQTEMLVSVVKENTIAITANIKTTEAVLAHLTLYQAETARDLKQAREDRAEDRSERQRGRP